MKSYHSFLFFIWKVIFCLLSVPGISHDLAISFMPTGQIESDCAELCSFAELVLDSSYFLMDSVPSEITILTEADWAKDCPSYPLVLTIYGFNNYVNDDLVASRSALLKADSLYKLNNFTDNRFFIRNNIFLGLCYGVDSDTLQSIQYLKIARDMAVKTENYRLMADALCNIGLTYIDNGEFAKAKKVSKQAMHYCIKSNNNEMLAFLYLNLGRIYTEENNWDLALENVKNAEVLFRQKDLRSMYFVEASKGEIFMEMKQSTKAIKCLENAYKLGEESNQKNLHGAILAKLGKLYEDIDNDKSVRFYELAFKNSTQLKEEEYVMVSNFLTSHYLETKDLDKFYKMFRDLSNSYTTRKELLKVEFAESNRREVAIQREISENEILRIKNKITTRNSIIILVSGLLCLTFAFYAYKQLSNNKRLNSKIKEQNIELKNFAYIASHDLKAPARSISSFAGLLKKRILSQDDPKSRSYIDVIEKSAKDMYQLVTSLLEFSSLENSAIEFTTIDTHGMFDDVLNSLYSTIELKNANINITNDFPHSIIGDEGKLKTVFQNLINNAIKFVPENRQAEVSVQYQEDSETHIFSITDNGIGISEEYLDKIFLMFQRLNSSGDYEGSGIGLSTCKKIVKLHNGKIEIDSRPNFGSTFYVHLPKSLA